MSEPRLREGGGLGRYLREAFLFRWNLLAFLGGAAAAAISPFPDVLLPLVGAAELLYLGGLVSVPRFRSAVDAQQHAKETAVSGTPGQVVSLEEILDGLDPAGRRRFFALRERCLEMQRLAERVQGNQLAAGDVRAPALDRLLWTFLRVLSSQSAMQRFLTASDEKVLRQELDSLRTRMEQAQKRGDERIARSLADAVATAELRLESHAKAVSNSEFLGVELDRIEGKIRALVEMAVSHQDADLISRQADSVADSLVQTEQAVREMNQLTGLGEQQESPPPILATKVVER